MTCGRYLRVSGSRPARRAAFSHCDASRARAGGASTPAHSALGSRPRTVTGLEKVAVGKRLSADVFDDVARKAFQQCHPLENIIVDPDWRRAMVPVYVRRALKGIAAA